MLKNLSLCNQKFNSDKLSLARINMHIKLFIYLKKIPEMCRHFFILINQGLMNTSKTDKGSTQSVGLIVGAAFFKSILSKTIKLQKKRVIDTLYSKIWEINHKNYQNENWKQIFEQIIKCQANRIQLDLNNNHTVLKQIQHVSFDRLNYLSLSGNNIDNIESLIIINFSSLKSLRLGDNLISRTNCFNKSSKSIKNLQLGYNPISEISSLARSQMNIQRFYFENQDYPIGEDLSLITKLNAKQLKTGLAQSKKRIIQQKVADILKAKCSKQFMLCHVCEESKQNILIQSQEYSRQNAKHQSQSQQKFTQIKEGFNS